MASANGAEHSVPALNASPIDLSTVKSRNDLLARLREPFDPADIKWLVKATANGRRGKQGLMVPYADTRTYSGRLNDVVTELGWTKEYAVQVVEGFHRRPRQKKDDKTVAGAKVLVICKLTIFGLGTHSGTGEAWADDENVLTSADAQAFKRACSDFGVGRYLYDIHGQWVDLNERDQPMNTPVLPEWAMPKGKKPRTGTAAGNPSERKAQGSKGASGPETQRLMSEIVSLASGVGNRLAVSVVYELRAVPPPNPGQHTFTPISELLSKASVTELRAVRKTLEDVKNEVDRLKAMIGAAGRDAYARVCAELSCPNGISDIADPGVLATLVDRMEALAEKTSTSVKDAPSKTKQQVLSGKTDDGKSNGGKTEDRKTNGNASPNLTGLKNSLVSLAREVASQQLTPIGEIISWASDSRFQFRDIGKLTEADIESLRQAVTKLEKRQSERF